jgi:hypothetical protein
MLKTRGTRGPRVRKVPSPEEEEKPYVFVEVTLK